VDCLSYALRLLSKKDYFSSELRQKLFQKGFSEDEISQTLDYLISENYINDEELLERYKRLSIEKGDSPLKFRAKLFKKGIKEVKYTYDEELQSALNSLKKYTKEREFKSVLKYLINRGFRYEIASDATKIFLQEEE